MERSIVGYHLDEAGDVVAELDCGHGQHVRHRPPFQLRPWVLEPTGRAARLGTTLACPRCDWGEPPDPAPGAPGTGGDQDGGEAPCLAHLCCAACDGLHGPGHCPGR